MDFLLGALSVQHLISVVMRSMILGRAWRCERCERVYTRIIRVECITLDRRDDNEDLNDREVPMNHQGGHE